MLGDRDFQEMLVEFRALGGVADNLRMGEGPLGRGLFAIDPAQPVRLHVPENLLIDSDQVVLENGRLVAAPDAPLGARERQFFGDFQARFSWGSSGRAEVERIFEEAAQLPQSLRMTLGGQFHCGAWFEPYSEDAVLRQFLGSRHFSYGERTVLMPMLELINHGQALNFEMAGGITVQGRVENEALVRYSDADSFSVFQAWGFAAEQPQAMCISLNGNVGGTQIRIQRDFTDFKSSGVPWIPRVTRTPERLELEYLMIGNRQYPRLCKGIFYKLMHDAGLQGYEEAFDRIQQTNQMHFLRLLEALEGVNAPMAVTLRRMARMQLETMSYSFGVRAM